MVFAFVQIRMRDNFTLTLIYLNLSFVVFILTAPLGVLDPLEQQNFYKNMNTGQRGSIYSQPVQTPTRDSEYCYHENS